MRGWMWLLRPTGWFLLWMIVPATLLYPGALWMARHSHLSGESLILGYSG